MERQSAPNSTLLASDNSGIIEKTNLPSFPLVGISLCSRRSDGSVASVSQLKKNVWLKPRKLDFVRPEKISSSSSASSRVGIEEADHNQAAPPLFSQNDLLSNLSIGDCSFSTPINSRNSYPLDDNRSEDTRSTASLNLPLFPVLPSPVSASTSSSLSSSSGDSNGVSASSSSIRLRPRRGRFCSPRGVDSINQLQF
mmetsp:Transcript_31197/g.53300  ORF Transcript_31197/g.53300 Transcript_31197/m.53300 type:complete len:197 (+) Transcript_31197:315-905(+)